MHSANDWELILRCMRQGAAEFLFPPIQHGTVPARDGLTKRAQAAMAQARSGEIYCLMRGKSGWEP